MLTFLFYWKVWVETHHFLILFSIRINILRSSEEVELFDLKGPEQVFLNKGILFYHYKLLVLLVTLNLIVRFLFTTYKKYM